MEKTDDDQRSSLEVTIHTAILILTFILSLAGNSLLCLAFYRNRRLRTIANFYVLSLAVADMTMAVFYCPFGAVASSFRNGHLPTVTVILPAFSVLRGPRYQLLPWHWHR